MAGGVWLEVAWGGVGGTRLSRFAANPVSENAAMQERNRLSNQGPNLK
jgi:hypothetical protein